LGTFLFTIISPDLQYYMFALINGLGIVNTQSIEAG
jgi:hypothetical protein